MAGVSEDEESDIQTGFAAQLRHAKLKRRLLATPSKTKGQTPASAQDQPAGGILLFSESQPTESLSPHPTPHLTGPPQPCDNSTTVESERSGDSNLSSMELMLLELEKNQTSLSKLAKEEIDHTQPKGSVAEASNTGRQDDAGSTQHGSHFGHVFQQSRRKTVVEPALKLSPTPEAATADESALNLSSIEKLWVNLQKKEGSTRYLKLIPSANEIEIPEVNNKDSSQTANESPKVSVTNRYDTEEPPKASLISGTSVAKGSLSVSQGLQTMVEKIEETDNYVPFDILQPSAVLVPYKSSRLERIKHEMDEREKLGKKSEFEGGPHTNLEGRAVMKQNILKPSSSGGDYNLWSREYPEVMSYLSSKNGKERGTSSPSSLKFLQKVQQELDDIKAGKTTIGNPDSAKASLQKSNQERSDKGDKPRIPPLHYTKPEVDAEAMPEFVPYSSARLQRIKLELNALRAGGDVAEVEAYLGKYTGGDSGTFYRETTLSSDGASEDSLRKNQVQKAQRQSLLDKIKQEWMNVTNDAPVAPLPQASTALTSLRINQDSLLQKHMDEGKNNQGRALLAQEPTGSSSAARETRFADMAQSVDTKRKGTQNPWEQQQSSSEFPASPGISFRPVKQAPSEAYNLVLQMRQKLRNLEAAIMQKRSSALGQHSAKLKMLCGEDEEDDDSFGDLKESVEPYAAFALQFIYDAASHDLRKHVEEGTPPAQRPPHRDPQTEDRERDAKATGLSGLKLWRHFLAEQRVHYLRERHALHQRGGSSLIRRDIVEQPWPNLERMAHLFRAQLKTTASANSLLLFKILDLVEHQAGSTKTKFGLQEEIRRIKTNVSEECLPMY